MSDSDSAKMYAKRGKKVYERGDYIQAAEDFEVCSQVAEDEIEKERK